MHTLKLDQNYAVKGLFTTVTEAFGRVSMHGVRIDLLQAQAGAIGLPLHLITLPYPCSNERYESIMREFVNKILALGINHMAFGDIYLEDVRKYREEKLMGSGISPLFPVWGQGSREIAQGLISHGFEAIITSLNPDQIPSSFIGRKYNQDFLNQLPPLVDPCGENGEFHTFVTNGPIFDRPVRVEIGEVVNRDGFFYIDLAPKISLF